MNEPIEPEPPDPSAQPEPPMQVPAQEPTPAELAAVSPSRPNRGAAYWAKRLLACNPLYLLSAALLLDGCYRISAEPEVVEHNSFHLFFNFGSLQIYEMLVVITAIFLASRRIWYDSTLLIGLENLLLFVPFILISHGALIGQGTIEKSLMWKLCGATGLLAVLRFGATRRLFAVLNFPPRAVAAAIGFLIINIALPVVYRALQESKVGTRPESGAAFYTNEWTWLAVLPALALAGLMVPFRCIGGEIWPRRQWLPGGMFALWLAGTAVHVYSLDYIYDYELRAELVAPLVCLLAWLVNWRAADVLPALKEASRSWLLVLPLLTTLAAAWPEPDKVFLLLTLLNVALYGALALRQPEHRLAFRLLLLSVAALIGGFPADWGTRILPAFNRSECLGGSAAACFLFWAVRSRYPASAILGGLVLALLVRFAMGDNTTAYYWALQAGLVFILLHSVRWEDQNYAGANWFRILIAFVWVAHAGFWMHTGGRVWMGCSTAVPVLAVYVGTRWMTGRWPPLALPIAATFVLLAGPADSGAQKLQTLSTGLLTVITSFVLFGAGTVAALTRHRWHRTQP